MSADALTTYTLTGRLRLIASDAVLAPQERDDLKKAADEIDRLRAALAAAQAAATKPDFDSNNMNWNYGYEKGFAVGIKAAAKVSRDRALTWGTPEEADEEANAILALRSLAAQAGGD